MKKVLLGALMLLTLGVNAQKVHRKKDPFGSVVLEYQYTEDQYGSRVVNGYWKKYYNSGSKKVIGQKRNDKAVGKWKVFSSNGKIQEVCNYVNDEYDGERLLFYENGKIKMKMNYSAGKKHGKVFTYYTDGSLETESNFVQGKMEGRQYRLNKLGKVNGEWHYQNGLKHGVCKEYYRNDTLKEHAFYQNGVYNGKVLTYRLDGTVETIGEYLNGKANGLYQWFYQSTQKESQRTEYVDDKKTGKTVLYWENGNPKAVMYYKDDKLDGYTTNYNEAGEITIETKWKAGVNVSLEGKWNSDNGQTIEFVEGGNAIYNGKKRWYSIDVKRSKLMYAGRPRKLVELRKNTFTEAYTDVSGFTGIKKEVVIKWTRVE